VLRRDRRQHDVPDGPVLIDERLEQLEALGGGRDGRVDEQAARLHLDHRHADRHVHVEDAKYLDRRKGPERVRGSVAVAVAVPTQAEQATRLHADHVHADSHLNVEDVKHLGRCGGRG